MSAFWHLTDIREHSTDVRFRWRSEHYPHGTHMKLFSCLWTLRWKSPQSERDQMKKVGLAGWQTSNGLPSASDPETEADRTPRGSLLACMTANREPRLIKALKRQEGDGLAASRRFFPFCGRFQKPAKLSGLWMICLSI